MSKLPRSTHTDLAQILEAHAGKLATVPAAYCVSDGSTRRALLDAARILVEQDAKIGRLTIALREHGGRAGYLVLASL